MWKSNPEEKRKLDVEKDSAVKRSRLEDVTTVPNTELSGDLIIYFGQIQLALRKQSKRKISLPLLKWYYAHFSLQRFGCNCYLFQKTVFYNDERQINGNVSC